MPQGALRVAGDIQDDGGYSEGLRADDIRPYEKRCAHEVGAAIIRPRRWHNIPFVWGATTSARQITFCFPSF